MKIIYFNQECEENFKEDAEVLAFNKKAEKFSDKLSGVAIGMCIAASMVAVAIMMFLC